MNVMHKTSGNAALDPAGGMGDTGRDRPEQETRRSHEQGRTNQTMTGAAEVFDPALAGTRAFRDALGQFVTGVTIVTCRTFDGPIGITANSFASVSLDPPLVLWSPAKRSARYPFFMAADHFAIHVLSEDQAALCRGFARSGDAFGQADWRESRNRVPLIEGCLARFECVKVAEHEGGDHTILVGQVTEVETREGKPLVFSAGRYGNFTEIE